MKFDLFTKKKFTCDMCEKKFKTATQLEEHRQLKHKTECVCMPLANIKYSHSILIVKISPVYRKRYK